MRLFERTIDIVGDAIVAADNSHRIIMFNHAAQAMFGYSADEVFGEPLETLLPPEWREKHAAWVEAFRHEDATTRHMSGRNPVTGMSRNGTSFPVGVTIAHFKLDGKPVYVAVVRDISEHVTKQNQLAASLREQELLALTDPLTGLSNRRGFCIALEHELEVMRAEGTTFTLVYIDLDHFKQINDHYGHNFGDYLLRGLAHQFQECFRERDAVARLGGDEFAVLSPQSEGSQVGPRVEQLREGLAADTADIGLPVSLSIGVLTCDAAPADAEACLHEADRVMYRVKHATRDGVVYGRFSDEAG